VTSTGCVAEYLLHCTLDAGFIHATWPAGIFFYEATHGSLTAISSLTFLTPMFAAGTGFLVLGERLSPLQLFGAAVTLAAVFMINTPASHKQQPSPTKER